MSVTVLSYPNLALQIAELICEHLMPLILPIVGLFLLITLVEVIYYVFNH